MTRSELFKSIRPQVDVAESSGKEAFQNITLRPILKLQHPLTQELLYTNKRYQVLKNIEMKEHTFTAKIKSILQTDKSIRLTVIGIVVGMMTIEEYTTYLTDTREYNKRIISMQVKRYVDTKFPIEV